MRVVFDTNIVISGRLWSGAPRHALSIIEAGQAKLLVSEPMVDELKDVLSRPKFASRLELVGKSAEQVVIDHLQFTEVIPTQSIPPTIIDDPDDDIVLACALSGKADCIVSGDPHLLRLELFEHIPILTVHAFLERFSENP
ncbi:MAG: putative toxin-antitoxin system toxin component, PIN family [Chloroflexota bacterium]